jgi:hypothetical protein
MVYGNPFLRPGNVQLMSRRWPGDVQETSRRLPEKVRKKKSVRTALGKPAVEQRAGAMGQKIRKSERKRLRDRSHRGRSEVYRFIRKNLAALQADGFGTDKGPSWDELAETINRQRITNQRGELVTWDAVRKVFARAVRDAALEPPPQNPAITPHRSRQREDWRPPLTRTEQPVGRRAPPPPPKAPTQGAYDHLPEDVKAQLTAVDEQFAYLDRHIIRPKQRS